MRIVATSDLHGRLPEIPDCDLLLIAGDVGPLADDSVAHQRQWLEQTFSRWLATPRCRPERVVWIAGNHDLALELGGPGRRLRRVATYLLDETVEVGGLKIYGTPWSEIIGPWAFSLEEQMTPDPRRPSRPKLELEVAFSRIPAGTDIALCHSPPRGILDLTRDGSPSLLTRLREVRPQLVLFGHIHEAYGRHTRRWLDERGGQHPVTLANVLLLDERCQPKGRPQVFEP